MTMSASDVPTRRVVCAARGCRSISGSGLTLGVVGALLGVTGSVLVYDRAIDGALNPQRYATSGRRSRCRYDDYAQRAARAVGDGARTVNLRLPARRATPVVAFVRARGDRRRQRRVYLDPPTGRVLDAPAGRGLIGWAHDLHGSLSLRDYNGREIVGVVGFAMLISSLSGIYLWWPRRRLARRDFTFRRGFTLSRNLHYTFGFYGSLVLAMLAFTGILLAFPEAGRVAVGVFRERVAVSRAASRLLSPPAVRSRRTSRRCRAAAIRKASVASVGISGRPARRLPRRAARAGRRQRARHRCGLRRSAVRHGAAASRSGDANAAATRFSPFSGRCTKAMRWVSPGAS